MIYQLNGRVHLELEPDVMRRLAALARGEANSGNGWDMVGQEKLRIGLCNFASAMENELDRLEPPPTPQPASEWD